MKVVGTGGSLVGSIPPIIMSLNNWQGGDQMPSLVQPGWST